MATTDQSNGSDSGLTLTKDRLRSRLEGLKAISSVQALRLSPGEARTARFAERVKILDFASAESAESVREEVAEADFHAFQDAGYGFFMPVQDYARAPMAARREITEQAASAELFVGPGRRLLVETDRMVVRFTPDVTPEQAKTILEEQGCKYLTAFPFAEALCLATSVTPRLVEVCLQLMESDAVELAEPDFVQHIGHRAPLPTDPDYRKQWHLNNVGQSGGAPGADIAAEAAWNRASGAGVRLAVIDNGFQVDHPDIQSGVSHLSGYFLDGSDPFYPDFAQQLVGFPDTDHGTFCAGMAAARANNGQGGVGVAFDTELTLIACLNDQVGTQATLARAVAYAADPSMEVNGADPSDGADAISCSLGPNEADWAISPVLDDALNFVATRGRQGRGAPIFWAVTNGTFEIRYDEVSSHPQTIAVGRSTDKDDHDGSGFGPELDFLATGVSVYNAISGGGYDYWTGTSFAAPCAAGVAALLLELTPDLTAEEVRQRLRATCRKIGPATSYDVNGHSERYGYGRIDARAAIA